MSRLFGAQRMVLQAIHDAQGETIGYIGDDRLVQVTRISLRDMRDWLLTLEQEELIDLALTGDGLSASITPRGRLALGLYRASPSATSPAREPGRTDVGQGRDRALVIGIGDYASPITRLPAVANDVREIAALLRSGQGGVRDRNVEVLVDREAGRANILTGLERTLREAEADDDVFVYMAGHGAVESARYYFVAHDTTPGDLEGTGVSLVEVREALRQVAEPARVLLARFLPQRGNHGPRPGSRGRRPRRHGTHPQGAAGTGQVDLRGVHVGPARLRVGGLGAWPFHFGPAPRPEGRCRARRGSHDQFALRLHRSRHGQRPSAADDVRRDDGADRAHAPRLINPPTRSRSRRRA